MTIYVSLAQSESGVRSPARCGEKKKSHGQQGDDTSPARFDTALQCVIM